MVIGCSSLLLQTGYTRGTKDSDILETSAITPEISRELLRLAGKNTKIHGKYRMYIDIVAEALPFLPAIPNYIEMIELNSKLKYFKLMALDPVDVIVSKMKTFRPQDVDDISAVIKMGIVDHNKLLDRFRKAMDRWQLDSRAEGLPQYIDNLHTVERDLLMASETAIELPRWIDEVLQMKT